jgi:hypothetical protein
MKTPNEILKLNYNDLAFFTNKKLPELKWEMSPYFYNTDQDIDLNLDKKGTPKIKVTDFVNKSDFESKINSCSLLDGKNYMDYVIESYNKGIDLARLRDYSEKDAYIKALKFTGKYNILNLILKDSQYRLLQGKWLLANVYSKRNWSDKSIKFIVKNKWAKDFLISKGINQSDIEEKLQTFLIK